VLITCFLGGAREPATGRLESAEVLPLVLRDLRELIGATGEPTFVHHQRWARAIPQYQLGHEAVVSGVARAESACPGLYLTGQWRAGVALGECIAQGQEMAARVVAERWMSGAA
jgi:oxygen-dependent protoporphyrinogen oxidase